MSQTGVQLDGMGSLRRTHACGEVTSDLVGSELVLAGWVHRRRDHGGVIFVDLRDGKDFKQGHIVDSTHIPLAKLAERMPELDKYRDKPVVLVCKMGQQSGAAGKQLRAAGFEKVYKMAGGMMEWGNLQLPTIR